MGQLDIGGSWSYGDLSIVQFDLYFCKDGISYDATNPNCTSFDKIANITGSNVSLALELLFPIVQF